MISISATNSLTSFKVCTYNMGADFNDYCLLCQYVGPAFQIQSEEEQKALKEKYQTAQEHVAARLRDQAEVFCLQEVVEQDRPLIKTLKERNFQIFKSNGKFPDCVIALNTDFENVENHSTILEGGYVAIVTATHKPTGERLTFVSAHAPGFNLEGSIEKLDAAGGDKYCQQIAEILNKIGSSTFQIIGADMNAYPEKWLPRFKVFSEKGFQVLRTGSSTNVMPKSSTTRERELDFILVKTAPRWLMSLFGKNIEKSAHIISDQPLEWKVDRNASDHLPVFAKISFQKQ